jgi:hypothetical protein
VPEKEDHPVPGEGIECPADRSDLPRSEAGMEEHVVLDNEGARAASLKGMEGDGAMGVPNADVAVAWVLDGPVEENVVAQPDSVELRRGVGRAIVPALKRDAVNAVQKGPVESAVALDVDGAGAVRTCCINRAGMEDGRITKLRHRKHPIHRAAPLEKPASLFIPGLTASGTAPGE